MHAVAYRIETFAILTVGRVSRSFGRLLRHLVISLAIFWLIRIGFVFAVRLSNSSTLLSAYRSKFVFFAMWGAVWASVAKLIRPW